MPRAPLAVLLLIGLPMAALPAEAQPSLECIGCSFEVDLLTWNDTGDPGSILIATFQVENTGEAADTYGITVSASDTTWHLATDKDSTGTLDAGTGLFAGPDRNATFSVTVGVPPDARAGAKNTITVTVTSQEMADDDAERTKTETLTANAARVSRWTLDCTDEIQVRRGRDTPVTFTAKNTGNDIDTTTVAHDPVEDLVPKDLPRFELDPTENQTKNGTVGASLRLGDAIHAIDWRLDDSRGDTKARCQTLVTVAPVESDGEAKGDTKENPGPPVLAFMAALALALATRRRT